LDARAAVAITPSGAKEPVLGTLEFNVATTVDLASRTVVLSDPKLVTSRFPSLDTQQAGRLDTAIRAALPGIHPRTVPLDSILLSLKRTEDVKPVAVNNDPPQIFHSERPASLVVFGGDPVLAPIGSTGLSFAVNTNWPVFSDGKSWYL